MSEIFYPGTRISKSHFGKLPLYVFIVLLLFVLAVLQDYIFSKVQYTGFYLSESMLYNTIWIFFIPFTFLINQLSRNIYSDKKWLRAMRALLIGVSTGLIHILMFACLFVLVSRIVFEPSHRFSRIFSAALSNQFFIITLWYAIFPAVFLSKPHIKQRTNAYPQKIKLKTGSKLQTVLVNSIELIFADKPYTAVYINGIKNLHSISLKEFESMLDPSVFLRVHRSTIINISLVKELKSRKNGDYDALLLNDQVVRLSRHYRNNWKQLLH